MKTPWLLVPACVAMLIQTACSKRELNAPNDLNEINKDGIVSANATAAPIHVEAENYTAMYGIQTEACREGGKNVGYIQSGDWMDYPVTTVTAGTHTISFRVAGSGGSLQIRKADGTVLADITLPNTGSGQVYTTVQSQVALSAGQQTLRIYATKAGWNFNWFELVSNTSTAKPIHVEAETYTKMQGIQTEACREGGQNVGYIQSGDWMDYSITTAAAGSHTISFRVAGSGGALQVKKADGSTLADVTLPNTGSGQVYTTVQSTIMLAAGQQTLRIYATKPGWNFNWFELAYNGSGALVSGTASNTATSTGNNLLFESTFENNDDLNKWQKEICRSSALVISKEVTPRKGNGAARFEFAKSDVLNYNHYVRAEIRQPSDVQAERWYGFSNYLPADFVNDPLAEKIAQWHEVPDWDLGENWRSPPISFGIENGRYYLQILWAAAAVNTNDSKDGEKKVDLGPVDKSKWNDWVFHIKFSYKSDGILEIYKNKVKVYSYYGPNSFNDKVYPYFKVGIYKWGWDGWASYSPESKRVLFYDEVRIGNQNSNVNEVSPR